MIMANRHRNRSGRNSRSESREIIVVDVVEIIKVADSKEVNVAVTKILSLTQPDGGSARFLST